jgi:ribose 5-phosphate isomerase B
MINRNTRLAKVAIGSDHAGFALKEQVKTWLTGNQIIIEDFGTLSTDSVDYPDYIHLVAEAVLTGLYVFGIIICGSGNGAAMTANKHKNIRAALCWLPEIASLARQHNNANIIALPARFITFELAKEIIESYSNAEFEGGRHLKRIEKIEL